MDKINPIHINESNNTSQNDQISLIELVIIVLKRKYVMAGIFILFCILGLGKAFLTPKNFTYSTSIEIGSQLIGGKTKPFESAATLVTKLQYSYIPQLLEEYRQANPDDKNNYTIKTSTPNNGQIILLELKGTENQKDTLFSLLQNLTHKAIEDHKRIYVSVKNYLHSNIKLNRAKLDSLSSGKGHTIEMDKLEATIDNLQSQLANLRDTHQILPQIQSLHPTEKSRKLIVAIFAIIGFVAGLLIVFFLEFIQLVKKKQLEMNERN